MQDGARVMMRFTVCLLGIVAGPVYGQGGGRGVDVAVSEPRSEARASSGTSPSETEPFVRLPAIDAYHDGRKVWFIHTEASDAQMAKRLTEMVDHRTVYAPRLGGVDPESAGKIYVFTNGISRRDARPWGGGPFHNQIDILDSVPGDEDYTPLRNPHLVTWNEDASPRVLRSEEELLQAERNGELTIESTAVIVNAPVVPNEQAEE